MKDSEAWVLARRKAALYRNAGLSITGASHMTGEALYLRLVPGGAICETCGSPGSAVQGAFLALHGHDADGPGHLYHVECTRLMRSGRVCLVDRSFALPIAKAVARRGTEVTSWFVPGVAERYAADRRVLHCAREDAESALLAMTDLDSAPRLRKAIDATVAAQAGEPCWRAWRTASLTARARVRVHNALDSHARCDVVECGARCAAGLIDEVEALLPSVVARLEAEDEARRSA